MSAFKQWEGNVNITDLAGISEPITKFLDITSRCLGTLYKPRAIRNEADAKAYEIVKIATASAEAERIQKESGFQLALNRISELECRSTEIGERARQRLLISEIEGQLNLESVLEHAYQALPEAVSKEPVEAAWQRRFFANAQDVCDEDMQQLWGKILAGEIAKPGAYSLRTIEALRLLTQHEAELFRLLCSLAMSEGLIYLPSPRGDLNIDLLPYGIRFADVVALRDAGLLVAGNKLSHQYKIKEETPPDVAQLDFLLNNGVELQLQIPRPQGMTVPCLWFTQAGRELQKLMPAAPNEQYLSSLGIALRLHGAVVKRGTASPHENGTLVTFETDL